jgi:hypothetical protein
MKPAGVRAGGSLVPAHAGAETSLAWNLAARSRVSVRADGGTHHPCYQRIETNERSDMYIGGGFLALILVILLLVWIF